ncbi:uncharacterized protein LOC110840395 isoform X2 [Zootermopsis nevadensis]|uniref:uncharacterized protein LOC110840395 isoform X2 n=1 Tax=Zootermopsis nevadensis TaxID=136037 RepID=UPI000B8EA508|nr:uncharacterized protein LOC110840395 isoform X2 [Zootermopsis nevadensis]
MEGKINLSGFVGAAVSVCWFLMLSGSSGTFISGEEALGSPLRVAQCRAQCLQACWENCELLQSNFPVWGAMCSERGICFPGCQQACRFHRETATREVHQSQPVIHTRGEEVVKMAGTVAQWPRPPTTSPSRPLVYVVMRRQAGSSSSWRQIAQTVELTVRLPAADSSNLGSATIRVLVVDPEGLVTIYSPVLPSESASPTGSDVISKVMAGHRKKINTEVTPTSTKSPAAYKVGGAWELREVSLIHQKVLVIAEVAWEPRVPRGVYLVTWEVDGGGLKGNLFTDSTCVTLSLWPDTIYHIQVELVSRTANHQPERSDPLVIDTHRAPQVTFQSSFRSAPSSGEPSRAVSQGVSAVSSPLLSVLVDRDVVGEVSTERRQKMELLAGTGTAVLLFLVVVGTLAWRCQRHSLTSGSSTIRRKKLVEDVPICRAGFHPIVTMTNVRTGNCSRGVVTGGAGRSLLCGGADSTSAGTGTAVKGNHPSKVVAEGSGGSLHASPRSQSEDAFTSTSSFLKEVERGARNEVQV